MGQLILVIGSLTVLFLLTFVFVSGQFCAPCIPLSALPDYPYDNCTSEGTFKSRSMCYVDTDGGPHGPVGPYHYYICVANGTTFDTYPMMCNYPRTIVKDPTVPLTNLGFFNPFDSTTGTCNSAAPDPSLNPTPAPPPPTCPP